MAEMEAKARRGGQVWPPPREEEAKEEPPPPEEPPPELAQPRRGAALRGARRQQAAARAPLGLAPVLPRVVTLVIAGEPVHGMPLTAQGHLQNCRCVRFQWLRSIGGGPWEAIPFATLPTFVPTVDDVGCLIAVEATPVTDDGFEGGTKRARFGPLTTLPDAAARRRQQLVAQARATPEGVAISDGVLRGGSRAVLTLRKMDVRCAPRQRRRGLGACHPGRHRGAGPPRRPPHHAHRGAARRRRRASLSVTFSGRSSAARWPWRWRAGQAPQSSTEPEPEGQGGILDVPTDNEAAMSDVTQTAFPPPSPRAASVAVP
jgi:hypothetical protein